MRVLLSADVVGGVWDYAVQLARGLHEAGHQVLLAVIGEPSPVRLAALPAEVEVTWREYRLEWMPDAAEDVAAAGEWLSRVARLWGADVVHLNQMAYTPAGFHAPTVVVVHSDVLSWFSEAQGRAAPHEWEPYARWVRRGLAAADLVVANSEYQSALTARHYGRAADRVIHNGVRPPAAPLSGTRDRLVLSVGRAWDEAKGMEVLDRALVRLGDAAPPAHLFGELHGPHGQCFQSQRLACRGRAERSEVDAWMRRAGVYVAASLYEPFGLAPLEAALHGCALVLSDIGSFRELWDGCAAFFPKGDADALARTLRQLVDDDEGRAALAAAAHARATRRYTAERFTADYLALYEQMAGPTAAGRRVPVESAAGTE